MGTRLCSYALLSLLCGVVVSVAQPLYTLTSPNEAAGGRFGCSVSVVGDVNHDGHADVVVGAHGEGEGQAGRAYVFSGVDGSALYAFDSPFDQGYPWQGWFGYSVAGAGDVNGDGTADMVIGARWECDDPSFEYAGRAAVFSGADGSLIHAFSSPNEQSFGYFGNSVSGAGDVNGDGFADVVVGALLEFVGGRAYVFSGVDGSVIHTLISPNEQPSGGIGRSVAGVGDINGDGFDDVIVGTEDEEGPDGRRPVYVFSGADGSLLLTIVSPDSVGSFGWSVAAGGDMNGDATPDLLVGDLGGRAWVFSGTDGSLLQTFVSPDVEGGGIPERSVSSAGDVNADGCPDVIVGAPGEDLSANFADAGRAYVFSGMDGSLLRTLVSPNQEAGGWFGSSVSGAGDVDGDGAADVIVGAIDEDVGAANAAGRAYIFSGVLGADEVGARPSSVILAGPHPNPVREETRLALRIPAGVSGPVTLRLLDLAGRQVGMPIVRDAENRDPILWHPDPGVAPGVYRWRVEAGGQVVQTTMVVVQ